MDNSPLAQLRDIHLPAPIGLWPLAPGWYLLLGVCVCLMIYLFWAVRRYIKHRRGKWEALRLLTQYEVSYHETGNCAETCARISELLKRVALVYYPRARVASLQGDDWIQFLKSSSKALPFEALAEVLIECPFKASAHTDLQPLFKTARMWIKQRGKPCLS